METFQFFCLCVLQHLCESFCQKTRSMFVKYEAPAIFHLLKAISAITGKLAGLLPKTESAEGVMMSLCKRGRGCPLHREPSQMTVAPSCELQHIKPHRTSLYVLKHSISGLVILCTQRAEMKTFFRFHTPAPHKKISVRDPRKIPPPLPKSWAAFNIPQGD